MYASYMQSNEIYLVCHFINSLLGKIFSLSFSSFHKQLAWEKAVKNAIRLLWRTKKVLTK